MENALNLCLIGFSLYYDRAEFVHEVGRHGTGHQNQMRLMLGVACAVG
jgi:hypothetical protein